MIKKIIVYFVSFILACSYTTTIFANDPELTLNEYKTILQPKDPKKLANDFKKYSHFIVKGHIIQIKIDTKLFKVSEKNLRNLEIKFPIGNRNIKISKDNKKFKENIKI